MRLTRTTKTRFEFRLAPREKPILLAVLKLYPRIVSAVSPLSKSGALPDAESCQRLLDDALAEQREENRRQLQALLADPKRFKETETGSRLILSHGDLEWLLQILNDIRIGSWLRLGSPEEHLHHLTEKNAPDLWAMEMSGAFVMQFLNAFQAPEEQREASNENEH